MRRQRGYRWAAWLAGSAALIMAATLALDAARLWAVRSELRVFTDSLAAAAARELDGTEEGIERARAVVLGGRQHSLVAAMLIQQAEAEFGESPHGPWRRQPGPECRCGYVRVRALAQVPPIGLPAIGRPGGVVFASAVAAMSAANAGAANARRASDQRVGYFTHP